jgi:hypothetical protein
VIDTDTLDCVLGVAVHDSGAAMSEEGREVTRYAERAPSRSRTPCPWSERG